MNVKVKKVTVCSGHDCWGRWEYDDIYVVTDENGNVLYRGEADPTRLVQKLQNEE